MLVRVCLENCLKSLGAENIYIKNLKTILEINSYKYKVIFIFLIILKGVDTILLHMLDSNRNIYTNEEKDITIIEIKDKDNINNNFLLLDDALINNDLNNYNTLYQNESVYILNYQKNNDYILTSYGKL